jgi:uncharacterized protein YeaO (DUF488 family)
MAVIHGIIAIIFTGMVFGVVFIAWPAWRQAEAIHGLLVGLTCPASQLKKYVRGHRMKTIKIKRIYDPAAEDDGRRILVDRLWPRGIKKDDAAIDEWLKDIAPSNELRKWFSHDPSKWTEFKERYIEELKQKRDMVERLRMDADKGGITLVFAAKDTEHNNAAVLMELIRQK